MTASGEHVHHEEDPSVREEANVNSKQAAVIACILPEVRATFRKLSHARPHTVCLYDDG
jgi:hypothetical protein